MPILSLPGNAAHDLQFDLIYNANAAVDLVPWALSLRGVPLRINNQADPPSGAISDNIQDTRGLTPVLVMGDGSERGMMFRDDPNGNTSEPRRWFITADLWKYDRAARVLYTPDGTTYTYDAASGKLVSILDVYGNQVTFDWFSVANRLTVEQSLGNGQSRTLTFILNGSALPTTVTYESRSWFLGYSDDDRELEEVTPPAGPHWLFTYEMPLPPEANRRLRTVTTPNGGVIEYEYEPRNLSATEYRIFLTKRTVTSAANTTPGVWNLEYAYSLATSYSGRTTIDTPSARLVYDYGPIGVSDAPLLIEGGIGLTHSEVQPAGGGSAIETDDRAYQQIPVIDVSGRHFDAPELSARTVRRWVGSASRAYTTQYTYSTSPSNFGDYHHPSSITETGEVTRTIAYTYSHPRPGSDADPVFVVGLPASETLTSDSEIWARCWV